MKGGFRPSPSLRIVGALFTILSLAFAGLLLVRYGDDLGRQWADLRASGWRVRPGWIGLSLLLGIGNLFLLGALWVRLLNELGGRLKFMDGMRIWTWTNLGRYLPGKVWQISALAVYMRRRRQEAGVALGSSIALQVLMLATGAALGFAVLGARLTDGSVGLSATLLAIAAAGLGIAIRPRSLARVSRWIAGRMGEPLPRAVPARGAVWNAAALTAVSWLVQGVGLWSLWRGLGGAGGPDVATWTGAFAAAYLVGYFAFLAPAGLLVRELALAGVLVGIAGVPAGPASGIALAARAWSVVSELLAAGIAWSLPGRTEGDDERAGMASTTETE